MISRPTRLSLLALALISAAGTARAQVTYDPPDPGQAPAGQVADPAAVNQAQVVVSQQAPPPLPVYQQPPVPGDGYMWVPGYWARNAYGFYWVPGAWVIAPYAGALWTPGYWGFDAGVYRWFAGYWGPHVGYYGGINYGFGYIGIGYVGGYWRDRSFYYNRSITNVNVTRVTNVYEHNVVVNNIDRRRVSYYGGPGGLDRRPTPQEEAARRDQHMPPTRDQRDHATWAGNNRAQWAGRGDGPRQVVADQPIGGPRAKERWNSDDFRVRPGQQQGQAPGNSRPGNPPLAGGNNNRPNDFNRPGQGSNVVNPSTPNRPDNRPGNRPENRPDNRPDAGARPGGNGNVVGTPNRPDNNFNRPTNNPVNNVSTPRERPQTRPENRPDNRPDNRPAARPDAGMSRPAPAPRPESANRPAARPENMSRPVEQRRPEAAAPRQENRPRQEAPRGRPEGGGGRGGERGERNDR